MADLIQSASECTFMIHNRHANAARVFSRRVFLSGKRELC
jgi:hypothetical protein